MMKIDALSSKKRQKKMAKWVLVDPVSKKVKAALLRGSLHFFSSAASLLVLEHGDPAASGDGEAAKSQSQQQAE